MPKKHRPRRVGLLTRPAGAVLKGDGARLKYVIKGPAGGQAEYNVLLTASELDTVRSEIAAVHEPTHGAWDTFVSQRSSTVLAATPDVYAGGDITPINTYTQLDVDGHLCRNAAILWALSGTSSYGAKAQEFLLAWATGNQAVPYEDTGDYVGYQGGYHQSYGYYSFALAYDLVKGYSGFDSGDHATLVAWFRDIADTLKTYWDFWTTQLGSGRQAYRWSTLTMDTYCFNRARDTSVCPLAAQLAAAIVSDYTDHIEMLYDDANPLNVPDCMHDATQPDNDGDDVPAHGVPVPNAQINATMDYMSYNTRVITMLYKMSKNLGRDTAGMVSDLHATWTYLALFSNPDGESSPITSGDSFQMSLLTARMQQAVWMFGDQRFLNCVGSSTPSGFYDVQYIGPITLMFPTP